MNNINIQDGTELIGELVLLSYVPVKGIPIKADNYYVIYELFLGGVQIPGTYFNDVVVNNGNIYICETHIDIDSDSFGTLIKTTLNNINISDKKIKIISELKNGFIIPKSVENETIVYTKRFKGNSAIHEFEQDI